MRRWLTVAVESDVAWPTSETRTFYCGHEFQLYPETEEFAPCVVAEYDDPVTMHQALARVGEFLSALSWTERRAIRDVDAIAGSRLLRLPHRPRQRVVTRALHTDFLPTNGDRNARLALALHRDGLNLRRASIPYAFLSFSKIINILHGSGPSQITWINDAVHKLSYSYEAQARAQQLRTEGKDIGEYLYGSGRCAVAHANREAANPDDPDDTYRLFLDLPLIQALAEYLIENELGVLSRQTIVLAHLYELYGFRSLLGEPLLDRICANAPVDKAEIPALPRISLRVRDHEPLATYTGMRPTVPLIQDGAVVLLLESPSGRLHAAVKLNFQAERMEFDPEDSVRIAGDDGSVQAIQTSLDQLHMLWWMILNGQLEIWDEDTQTLLGRSDPYVPVNVNAGLTIAHLTRGRDALLEEFVRRRGRTGSSPDQRA